MFSPHKGFLLVCIGIFIVSCSKTAGPNGKATVHVHLIQTLNNNFAMNLANTNVMVNYNSSSFPGNTASGDNNVQTNENGLAEFNNLKRGDYYFFVISSINDTLFSGGQHICIESRKGEQHIVIDIGEENPY